MLPGNSAKDGNSTGFQSGVVIASDHNYTSLETKQAYAVQMPDARLVAIGTPAMH